MAAAKDREEFCAVLAWELKGRRSTSGEEFRWTQALEFARFLMRSEVTLHRLAEEACNRNLTPAEERRELGIMDRVRTTCLEFGLGVEFNGDPRGSAIKLMLPSGRSNSFVGAVWCVP